ncbi:vitamin B12 dependent methionine synthase [uncultured Thomasclavelia sp.]|uniref:vitamin B12 dependent methionine synthase n=1 Tax=uncultured Thomasclavelia sp. TaxID=3025759 RepID=UPI0025F170DA|nr:vitamin B12 dependent methionine synthase [uncultured Thomasclavelia sp.]
MIKENALKYLGYQNQKIDNQTEQLLNECLQEITQFSPKIMYQIFTLSHQPLTIKELDLTIDYPDLIDLFDSCNQVVVIACTLGLELDKKLKYYSIIDLTKMTILDAVASSYLEAKCDEFEAKQNFGLHTFRFCPGYGNVPIELNRPLAKALQCDKHIGLTVLPDCLLLPQKSMIGLIGIGNQQQKRHCFSCYLKDNCQYRKRGQRCYKID